jgi:hypothetical protein
MVTTFRFLALVLTALILGGAFCHVLELPVKMTLDPADYIVVQQIYGGFGPVGAVLEPGAIAASIVLAFLRRRRRGFGAAVIGVLFLLAALASWAVVVNPVNAHWAAAGPHSVPPDFESLRARWEYGHALHAALLFAAFVSVVVSVLAATRPAAATGRLDSAVDGRAQHRDHVA